MTQQILVSNPTPYARRETVTYGCPLSVNDEQGGKNVFTVPGAQVRTATIEVGPYASGYQDLKEVQPFNFDNGFRVNNLTFFEDDEPYPFAYEETLVDDEKVSVKVFKAVGPGSVGRMVIQQAVGEPWFRYQFLPVIVSTAKGEVAKKLGYLIDSGPGGVSYDRLKGTDTQHWHEVRDAQSDPDGLLRDGTGLHSEGVHIQAALVAKAEDPALLSTAMALATWDLTVAGDWRAGWGPWNTVPQGFHSDRRNSFELRDHIGVILDKRPGSTGEQFGFGLWKHVDIISQGNGNALDHDKWAVGKECNRPIWWLNTDGTWPTKAGHPNFKSWSEMAHWHKGVSPDQFGRIHGASHYVGWLGMDEEHVSCCYLKEDFFLRGSFLTYLILRQKAFLLKTQGRWSGTGRALGRIGMAAWDCYQATGDTELFYDMKDRFVPSIKGNFWAVNKTDLSTVRDLAVGGGLFDRAYATRIIQDDPHTGIKGFGWYVWEDAIAVAALDKLAELFVDPELSAITYMVSGSVCLFGINDGEGGDGRILKAIKWEWGKFGPEKASSRQTNYHDWGYAAYAIAARMALEFGDAALAKRAGELGELVRKGAYGNRHSYLAPAP